MAPGAPPEGIPPDFQLDVEKGQLGVALVQQGISDDADVVRRIVMIENEGRLNLNRQNEGQTNG